MGCRSKKNLPLGDANHGMIGIAFHFTKISLQMPLPVVGEFVTLNYRNRDRRFHSSDDTCPAQNCANAGNNSHPALLSPKRTWRNHLVSSEPASLLSCAAENLSPLKLEKFPLMGV